MSAIVVEDLVAGYDGVPVVRGLNLVVEPGEVVALLGPNGAGKSTTLWSIAGALPLLGGAISVLGRSIAGMTTFELARHGLAFVPEDRALFSQLTVSENLRFRRRKGSAVAVDRVLEVLPALAPLMGRKCALLSGGEQQMLALGCALIASPRALMIDEMSLGLAPVVVDHLLPVVRDLAEQEGMAVLLVEQHVHAALKLAGRAYVLSHGELVLEGASADLLHRRDILESSYLGSFAIS